MRITHAARTDVGMKRDNNEDNLLVFPEQYLYCVFDGMGGHAAGEVASGIAAREIKEFFISYNRINGKKFKILQCRGPRQAKRASEKGIKQFKKSGQKDDAE